MSCSDCAQAGEASAPRMIDSNNALTACSKEVLAIASTLGQERAGVGNFSPAAVGGPGDGDDLAKIFLRLGGVTGLLRGLGRAHIGLEPVRFLLQRRLKSGQRCLLYTSPSPRD